MKLTFPLICVWLVKIDRGERSRKIVTLEFGGGRMVEITGPLSPEAAITFATRAQRHLARLGRSL